MEPIIEGTDITLLPRPLTVENALIAHTYEATGKIPYKYQHRVALALYNKRDVLCIAGTGMGKTLPTNKLRAALLSDALGDRIHITVFDEAHCIKTWGDEFRRTYARCGDIRPLMKHPEDCPTLAATATAPEIVKSAIITGLKLRTGFHVENLGNFRPSLCYGVYRMTGGQKSYSEIGNLFPGTDISKLEQSIVFVNSYLDAHAGAAAVRKKFGLKGKEARDTMPVYHSLKSERSKKRIAKNFRKKKAVVLFTSDAITMGADFQGIGKVINYLAPRCQVTWAQRSGRGARGENEKCDCIIMATPKMIRDAEEMCQEAGIDINLSGQVYAIELKPEIDQDQEDEPEQPIESANPPDEPSASTKTKGRYAMSLSMAEYLVTEGCLVEVLDREFNNPPHVPCALVGGCQNCVRKRQKEEDEDRLAQERSVKREETIQDVKDFALEPEQKHKDPPKSKEYERTAKDTTAVRERLSKWRDKKYEEIIDEMSIPLDAFMTDKELRAISKVKISSLESFQELGISWPAPIEWKVAAVAEIERIDQELENIREQKRQDDDKKRLQAEADRKARADSSKQAKDARRLKKTSEPQQPSVDSAMANTDIGSPSNSLLFSSYTPAIQLPVPSKMNRLGQGRPVKMMRINTSTRLPAAQSARQPYPSPITPKTSLLPNSQLVTQNNQHPTTLYTPNTPTFQIQGYVHPQASSGPSGLRGFSGQFQADVPSSSSTANSVPPQQTPSRPRGRKKNTNGFIMYAGPPAK
ncbi:Helicase conserved C-terminal domain [Ceratobasidium sp. AG-Ba]|nr:Helicase conserved C-terminal domain [Ceratobasidium sp. AG-Ba]